MLVYNHQNQCIWRVRIDYILFLFAFSCVRDSEFSDPSGKRQRSMHRRSSTDIGLETPVSRQISKGLELSGTKSNREATGVSSGTIPLMETGGLNWFVGMHMCFI